MLLGTFPILGLVLSIEAYPYAPASDILELSLSPKKFHINIALCPLLAIGREYTFLPENWTFFTPFIWAMKI